MFVVFYYLVQLHSRSSNHGCGFCLAMVLLINIVLVINYYEINKSYEKNVLRFIGVIIVSLSNVIIIGIKRV
jgi:Na+-translocating ferredoxin:NAD+ oxidoreductase RnfA subunit